MSRPTNAESFLRRRRRELSAEGPTIPISFDRLREVARESLPPAEYDYVDGAAGTEGTMRANRAAFDRYRIVPRVLRDVSEIDLGVELFGRELAAPVVLSPVGRQRRFHEEGERATARAAAGLGVPFTMSTWSSTPIEDIAEQMGNAPRFFQLYWLNDWDVTASLVRRAEQADYDAILLTVDSKLPKWRVRNLENDYQRARADVDRANLVSDPVVTEQVGDGGIAEAVEVDRAYRYDRAISWEDLDYLREQVDLPILLKGVLHPDDATRAVDEGIDGIVVSTHGGRSIDGAIPAVDALPGVVEAVDGGVPVLLDSGVLTGSDVFRALALGATAAFVGRPFVFGLSVAGERGVYEAVANILAELESVLGLSGRTSPGEIGPGAVIESD